MRDVDPIVGQPSMASVRIRPALEDDLPQIVQLVVEVVGETYGHLFKELPPVPNDFGVWGACWSALIDDMVIGIGLACGDYIDDLWIKRAYRGQGIGTALLGALERQIAGQGHTTARLRVVAENEGARRFYMRHGWQELKLYPHEVWGFPMLDMSKALASRCDRP
jgi:GNAT superfamily N-acetyltransferase